MPYIDRDNLIKELSTMYKSPTSADDFMTVGYDHAIADMVVTVHEHPAAEVVELVRCKDCKHRDGEDGQCPLQTTGDPYLDTYPQNNFYCADGERREDYAEVH